MKSNLIFWEYTVTENEKILTSNKIKENKIKLYKIVMISKKNEIPQLKYLIGCVDTHLGQAIVEQVRNDQINTVNPHIILGFLSQITSSSKSQS